MNTLIDHPLLLARLFYPRAAPRDSSQHAHAHDGCVPAADPAYELGYRLYRADPDAPILLFFHGNGEIAADYDAIENLFTGLGLSLLVCDYRGYGWSTGTPLGSQLLPDAEAIHRALPTMLGRHDIPPDVPIWLMGRSLGGAAATHLAASAPDTFRGLILESTFAHTPSLLSNLGLPRRLVASLPDPYQIGAKIRRIRLPLLVIHGERDSLIPVEHGQLLYDTAAATHKRLVRIPGAGHNDLLMVGLEPYLRALAGFIEEIG